jgi:hypothetical protein
MLLMNATRLSSKYLGHIRSRKESGDAGMEVTPQRYVVQLGSVRLDFSFHMSKKEPSHELASFISVPF